MNSETPQFLPLRTIKSYVIRAGRMTAAQKQALATLWPRYGLDPQAGLLEPDRAFPRPAPLILEIGFGMGDSLAGMARARPERNYLGVEVHRPGVGNILRLAQEQELDNLRVYQADAKDVLTRCIAPDSLAGIQIFFPDPWPKKRHHKRRLIQPDFVQELRRCLQPGGYLHLATDWQPYADYMLAVMSEAPGFRNAFGRGNWAGRGERPPTKFELRGQKLGHGVRDLVFIREE